MRKNDNPIFALVPHEVLLKAKLLSGQFRAEHQLEDVAGRSVFLLAAIVVLLLLINGANAFVFMAMATSLVGGIERPIVGSFWVYAFLVWIGGTTFMFNAIVTWLELGAFRRANPLVPVVRENMRFYKRSTWVPLVLLSIVPAVFNFLFSLEFFLVTVSSLFILAILYTVKSDV